MPEAAKPVYLVDAYSDPVLVRIEGRACFQNSSCLHDFIGERIKQGKTRFLIDFQGCVSMDSTFLGVLAGAGLQIRRLGTQGSLVLARMNDRNLELARNLGLHRLATVDSGNFPMSFGSQPAQALRCDAKNEIDSAKHVLEAHENLVSTDEANRSKFQDVLAFLKNRVAQG